MTKLNYEEPKEYAREDIEKMLASSEEKQIQDALLSIGLYGEDWKWSQDKCLEFVVHSNENIAGLAVTCLGHIARIHRELDKKTVLDALKKASQRSELSGRVGSAISDINVFIK